MTRPATVITLRALEGSPLADDSIRRVVASTAHAIAERTGVELLSLSTEPDRITVALAADRIAAIGFAAELRRLTTAWYKQKHHADTLWGEAPEDLADHEPDEPWR